MKLMRWIFPFVAAGLLAIVPAASAADDSALAPPIACSSGVPGTVSCILSKKDVKEAQSAYRRGLRFQQRQHPEEALAQFEQATRLVPQNLQYLTAREVLKSKLIFDHIERGNALLAANIRVQAAAEFHAALDLDPDNQYASERISEATRPALDIPEPLPAALQDSVEIHLEPQKDRASFQYRGDVRGFFNELATTYGFKVQFDDSIQSRQVRFTVEDVSFFTALKLACQVSKTMWAAIDAHQFLIAADTPDNHKQFDRMSLQTFVLPAHTTSQDVNEFLLALRNMFDLKFVSSSLNADTVEVRAPQPVLASCARLLDQLRAEPRPQVRLNIRVYQISHQLTRDIGLHIPNTFNMYNIPAAALVGLGGLGGQNIQQLINQLISSGGINQAGSSSLSGLLAQLGGQQNNIFSQPLATFGGGLTFMGLSLDQLSAALSVNESWSRSLENVTLRAGNNNEATFHLGTRYPIQNASYAPIYNSPQISQVLGNQSYIPPFPSVSYEDLGLNVKAKPAVHGDGSVTLKLEMQVRSLTGQSNNGVPVISNREFNGDINLKDGEPAVVAGEISRTDMFSMGGIPGLGMIPGLNRITTTNSKQEDDDELMIIITPHIVSNFVRSTPTIWVSEK